MRSRNGGCRILAVICAGVLVLTACGTGDAPGADSGQRESKFENPTYDGISDGSSVVEIDGTDSDRSKDTADENAGQEYGVRSEEGRGNADVDTQYVRILPGTDANMLSADFWIDQYKQSGGDDSLIMTPEEIRACNEENEVTINLSESEYFTQLSLVDTMDGTLLRHLVDMNELPEDFSGSIGGNDER